MISYGIELDMIGYIYLTGYKMLVSVQRLAILKG